VCMSTLSTVLNGQLTILAGVSFGCGQATALNLVGDGVFLWNLWLWVTTAVTASTFELIPTLTFINASEQVSSGLGLLLQLLLLLLLLFCIVGVVLFSRPTPRLPHPLSLPLPVPLSPSYATPPHRHHFFLDTSTVFFPNGICRVCSTLA